MILGLKHQGYVLSFLEVWIYSRSDYEGIPYKDLDRMMLPYFLDFLSSTDYIINTEI